MLAPAAPETLARLHVPLGGLQAPDVNALREEFSYLRKREREQQQRIRTLMNPKLERGSSNDFGTPLFSSQTAEATFGSTLVVLRFLAHIIFNFEAH